MGNSGSSEKSVSVGTRAEYLDAFRGFIMFSMLIGTFGLGKLAEHPLWGFIYRQLSHSHWRGFTFEDIILPSFLFIIGLAMPFSYEKRQKLGQSHSQIRWHAVKRTIGLFALGVLIRFVVRGSISFGIGILQILAISYFAGFLLLKKSIKIQASAFALILFLYWFFIFIIPLPGIGANSYIDKRNIAWFLDSLLLSEDVVSKFGYIYPHLTYASMVILGSIIGRVLVKRPPQRKVMTLLAILGVGGILAGLVLNPLIPIIRPMFTSSCAIFACGWICLMLLGFYWLIDVRACKRWSFVFKVFGMNSIFIYAVHRPLGGWIRQTLSIFVNPFDPILGAGLGPLKAFLLVIMEFLLCLWLYRKRIFIKI
ncbi:MAG TPA: DUF5009 domain-containing protein [bacterium]|nr:DUF5009 domain-containing protein [bacterium]